MTSRNIPKPKPLNEQNAQPKFRLCLKCQLAFSSVGNRICNRCSEKNAKVGKRVEHGGTRGIPGTIKEGH